MRYLLAFIMVLSAAVSAGEEPPLRLPAPPEHVGKPTSDMIAPAKGVPAGNDNETVAPVAVDDKVTVNFRDTEIMAVVDFYSKLTGKAFIVDNKLKAKITVISPEPVTRAQALAMFDTILSMQGYGLIEGDGYIKVIQRSKISRDAWSVNATGAPSDRIVTEVVTLNFVTAQKLLEQVRPLLSQEGNVLVSEHLNSLVITDTAGNIEKVKGIITALDQQTNAVATKVYHLKFASAEKLSASLPNLLAGGDKDGVLTPSVAMDKDTNSIILTGIPMIHHRMSQLMKELDIRKGQVLIEAKVVEVSHEASSRFGFEWELARNLTDPTRTIKAAQSNFNLDTSNQLDSVAGLRLSFLKGGEWTALLNAYATSEQANLLSCPHLVAMDGETAKLHVGEEIPILKESRVDSNNNPVNSYDYEKVGIDLSIKPTIVGDNEVVLVIKQEVSTLLQYNEERLTHRIGERLAETTVIMKDRHTLVIGGLLEDSRRKSNTGVPVLREIPVLGKLFSQQAQNSSPEKTELLIFITPRIMKSHDEADDITEEMQERHPNTYSTSGEDFRL